MLRINEARRNEDLLLKIGIHEGLCLAVTMNNIQDYFGQTVNVASRVQGLASHSAIFVTKPVVNDKKIAGGGPPAGFPHPRQHSERQVIQLADAIQECGFVMPVVVDHKGQVVIGHGRLLAAKKLGMPRIPVVEIKLFGRDQSLHGWP